MTFAGNLLVRSQSTGGTWTPADISTALWLDAADASTVTLDGSTVSQWDDKSGNGRNASQGTSSARPVLTASALNGLNAITFDGSNDFMSIANSFMATTTLIIACVVKENNGGFGGIITSKIGSPATDNSPALDINTSRLFEYDFGSLSPHISTTNGSSWGVVVGQSLSNTSSLIAVNGTIENSSSNSFSISSTASSTALGTYRVGDSNYGAFDLGELLVLTSNSTLETRQHIEGYLAHKWGLTANLPAGHPYKSVAP